MLFAYAILSFCISISMPDSSKMYKYRLAVERPKGKISKGKIPKEKHRKKNIEREKCRMDKCRREKCRKGKMSKEKYRKGKMSKTEKIEKSDVY